MTYDNLQVTLGINLTTHLGADETTKGGPRKVTKKALREALAEHPEWDFRIIRGPFAPPTGTYINRADMRREGVRSLECYDQRTSQLIGVLTLDRSGKWVVR